MQFARKQRDIRTTRRWSLPVRLCWRAQTTFYKKLHSPTRLISVPVGAQLGGFRISLRAHGKSHLQRSDSIIKAGFALMDKAGGPLSCGRGLVGCNLKGVGTKSTSGLEMPTPCFFLWTWLKQFKLIRTLGSIKPITFVTSRLEKNRSHRRLGPELGALPLSLFFGPAWRRPFRSWNLTTNESLHFFMVFSRTSLNAVRGGLKLQMVGIWCGRIETTEADSRTVAITRRYRRSPRTPRRPLSFPRVVNIRL